MPTERHLIAFADQAEVIGSLDVGTMWDRLRGEFLDEWAQLERQGLSPSEMDKAMQAFMDALSEKPIEKLARTSASTAYTQGREAEILSRPEVEFVVRSSVLERGTTCDPCWTLDSEVIEVDSPDFAALQPPAECEGGRQCRCFYIPVTSDFV